jgi:uncharacterized protein
MNAATGINATPKEVVVRFLELMATGEPADLEKAGRLFADDVSFWIAGRTAISGTVCGREAVMDKRFRPSRKRTIAGTLLLKIGIVLEEGEYVAAEWTSRRQVVNSPDYENAFFGLFQVRNGKIQSLREYLDTQAVVESGWRHMESTGAPK